MIPLLTFPTAYCVRTYVIFGFVPPVHVLCVFLSRTTVFSVKISMDGDPPPRRLRKSGKIKSSLQLVVQEVRAYPAINYRDGRH